MASPQAKRRKAADAELAVARDDVELRAYGRCEANTPACEPREHRGTQVHHRLRRAQGGGHELDNLLLVCDEAHEFIHQNPAASFEAGWLIRGVR
jgi:hypothetical protein